MQKSGLAVWLKVKGTWSNASPAGLRVNLCVSQTKQSQFDLYGHKHARHDHWGPSSRMPYLCWLFWSFYTKQEKNTACLTVWNQSQALMWSLGRQEGWGKWERREARGRQGERVRESENASRWKVADKDCEAKKRKEKKRRVARQHSGRAQLLSESGELKERPLWSRCVDAIQEVTGVNWKCSCLWERLF